MNELFILPPKVVAAAEAKEIAATVAGLKELGLYKLPYPKVDLQFSVEMPDHFDMTFKAGSDFSMIEDVIKGTTPVVRATSREDTCLAVRFIGITAEGECEGMVVEAYRPKYKPLLMHAFQGNGIGTASNSEAAIELVQLLIVMLATKNAIKTIKNNKLARLGIGRKHKGFERGYPTVTTISIPTVLPDDEDHVPGTGSPKCAHLRRGHIRRQKYGPKRSYIRQIWIDPIFVNADETFVSNRKAYNVSL